MTPLYDTCTVIYHSEKWHTLVSCGWITKETWLDGKNTIALMILKVRQ